MEVLPVWLQHWARSRPDHPAIVDRERVVSFAELEARVELASRRLARLGVRKGDRVALLLQGGVELVDLVHALPRMGAVVLPIHRRLTAKEIEWQLQDSSATLLCYDATSRDKAAQLSGPRCCVAGQPLDGDRELESTVPAPTVELANARVDSSHSLLYTSGTTGRAKAVELSWGNHYWSAIGSAFNLGVNPSDRWLACLPFAHVGGLSILLRGLIYGTTTVVMDRFDPVEVNRTIDTQGITIVSLVANMLQRMIDARGGEPYPATLRCVLLGGGPAPRALLEACVERHIPVVQTYGLTETASQVTTMPMGDAVRKIGSSGRPLVSSRVRIVEAGRAVAAGEVGEILVSGPTVSETARRRSSCDGWLRTGDLGKLDEEGFLYVVGRRDDTIISGGENVHPIEVETVLESHPGVAEACVVGKPDPEWGQVVTAYVRLLPGIALAAEELRAHARRELAGFKVPRRVVFVDELPRTPSGKVSRREVGKEIGR